MSAIVKACNITNTPKNTGKQCDSAMVATAMLIAMQSGLKFTLADLADPVEWLTTLIHQKKAFPLFGQKAPIREITNDTEGDQIVTLDDGLKVFLRYGLYNRMFSTTSGGLCYADALQSFLNSGYDVLEIDQQGQMLARDNGDGTFSPLITDFMYSPAPILPDFKTTPYKNRFSYSFSPVELVQNGIIFKGASALLSMQGLIDSKITEAAAATVTTPAVAATRTVTITAIGADDDTIDILQGASSISGGPVIQTAAETTVTLLAAKIKAAINAATATNGGYTADNLAGVLTITAPLSAGATVNASDTAPVVVGTITDTHTAFGGGVTQVSVLKIGVESTCSDEDLVDKFGAALGSHINNFEVADVLDLDTPIAANSASIVSGHVELVGPWLSGHTYSVAGSAPTNWLTNLVEGYDASENPVEITVP
jgi:hypothetical protein